MSFDLARTPTLEVVATEDEKVLSHDLQTRVEQAIQQAEAQPEVVEAVSAQRSADTRLGELKKAERVLNQFAKEARNQMAAASDAAIDSIVASAAAGGPKFANLKELALIEVQSRYVSRAIERIVEHLIPGAQIKSLREESNALMTTARTLKRIAHDRAEKLVGQLREAVTEEVVLPVDMSKGVSGALLAQALELKRRAGVASEDANRLEKSYGAQREATA
ncbi:MAG: hypothetical protein LAP39_30635 [Acidobacteriia bacterium]|nr:hypothetical protein [Terriglobia bacterium]